MVQSVVYLCDTKSERTRDDVENRIMSEEFKFFSWVARTDCHGNEGGDDSQSRHTYNTRDKDLLAVCIIFSHCI